MSEQEDRDSLDATTEAEQAELEREFRRVTAALREELGRESRWSGRISLVAAGQGFYGVMRASGDVEISIDRWRDEPGRLHTLIHEALHGFSTGFVAARYVELPGWEEGVVERLTRLLRGRIAATLRLEMDATALTEQDVAHAFGVYLEALDKLWRWTQLPEERFYRALLNVPIHKRFEFLAERARQVVPPEQWLQFLIDLGWASEFCARWNGT